MSVAIAGSQYMYPAILAAHGVGMAFVVGLNTAVALRVLGVARALPLPSMTSFYPAIWSGLWLNAITGILLAMAAATRVMVDPVFYAKLLFIILAVVNLRRMKQELVVAGVPNGVPASVDAASGGAGTRYLRNLAIASMVFWAGAVTMGRLMGYQFFRFWQWQ